MARIVGHLPVAELEVRYRTARDATAARHYQAIWLLAQGRTFGEVAKPSGRKRGEAAAAIGARYASDVATGRAVPDFPVKLAIRFASLLAARCGLASMLNARLA